MKEEGTLVWLYDLFILQCYSNSIKIIIDVLILYSELNYSKTFVCFLPTSLKIILFCIVLIHMSSLVVIPSSGLPEEWTKEHRWNQPSERTKKGKAQFTL